MTLIQASPTTRGSTNTNGHTSSVPSCSCTPACGSSKASACSSLGTDRSTPTLSSSCCTGERKTRHRPPLEHDAFREGALGETGWRILDRLMRHPGPRTQTEVARSTGIHPGTVNRHVTPVSPLVSYGLVQRVKGTINASLPLDETVLDTIARDLGTHGHRARHLAGLRAEYVGAGTLDDGGWWIDRDTGERRGYAAWLADPGANVDQPTRHAPSNYVGPNPGRATSGLLDEGTAGPGPEQHPTPLPLREKP